MTVDGIIMALIVGLIIGALGRLALPRRQNIPLWLTLLIAVVAALIGSAIARAGGYAGDWRELLLEAVFAAIGIALTVGLAGRGQRRVSH